MLMKEGLDYKYGARHLKRAVERFLVYPLSNLVATGQIGLGDLVHVVVDGVRNRLVFSKILGGALILAVTKGATASDTTVETRSGGVGVPIPQVSKAAKKGQGREKTDS